MFDWGIFWDLTAFYGGVAAFLILVVGAMAAMSNR